MEPATTPMAVPSGDAATAERPEVAAAERQAPAPMRPDAATADGGPAIASAGAPAISFRNVALTLGGAAIYENLSFEVAPGEFVCLLGPSGCGKSTALRLMGDLLDPSAGEVRIEGLAPDEAWERIAYVFQSPRLLPWKTALDNAAFGLEMRRPEMPAAERRAVAERELVRVGLGRDLHKMPVMLSGGERQRVAIARALVLDPDIVLMDEPFSALDPQTRRRLRRELVELWQETGKTIVFVTHDVDEAFELADRILVLAAKPAEVRRTVTVTAPRPRDVDTDPALRAERAEVIRLFDALAEP